MKLLIMLGKSRKIRVWAHEAAREERVTAHSARVSERSYTTCREEEDVREAMDG
jgi:hypothetical protein